MYSDFIRFRDSDHFAIIGTGVFPGSMARPTTARFEIDISRSSTDAISNTALYVSAKGCPERYSDVGKNVAIEAIGMVRITNSNKTALHIGGKLITIGTRTTAQAGIGNRFNELVRSWDTGEILQRSY